MKTHHGVLIGLAALMLAACAPMGAEMGDMEQMDMGDTPALVDAPDGEISVSGAWVRTPAMAGGNGAGYMIISNRTDSDDRLVAAEVDFANVVEIHETYMVEDEGEGMAMGGGAEGTPEGGMDMGGEGEHEGMEMGDVMGMRPVEGGLLIPAGQDAVLQRGGYHVMLIDVPQPPEVGSTVTITLIFESGLTLDVQAEVREG